MSLLNEVTNGIIKVGEDIFIDNEFVEAALAVGAVVVATTVALGAKKLLENSSLKDVGDIIKSKNNGINLP